MDCFVPGFSASGVSSGVKADGALDLALITCDVDAPTAACVTSNIVKGHSLLYSIDALAKKNSKRAVLINSGNANACVGSKGDDDARELASATSAALGCDSDDILLASTGVIGRKLEMGKLLSGITTCSNSLGSDADSLRRAAQAILTTDTVVKQAKRTLDIDGRTITLAGIAKGSGMIAPNMATMICVLMTDAKIDAPTLQHALKDACDVSFNRISVDGDMSVCDTTILMASGVAENRVVEDIQSDNGQLFIRALKDICIDLAKQIVRDGEGAAKLITVNIQGAKTAEDAHRIARSIANSPLCKTAMFGEDANWGVF